MKGRKQILPPKYLLVDGHESCLSKHKSCPGDTYNKVCVPENKPKNCQEGPWSKIKGLQQVGQIDQCNTGIFPKYFVDFLMQFCSH